LGVGNGPQTARRGLVTAACTGGLPAEAANALRDAFAFGRGRSFGGRLFPSRRNGHKLLTIHRSAPTVIISVESPAPKKGQKVQYFGF
jgi:hypothetical protein